MTRDTLSNLLRTPIRHINEFVEEVGNPIPFCTKTPPILPDSECHIVEKAFLQMHLLNVVLIEDKWSEIRIRHRQLIQPCEPLIHPCLLYTSDAADERSSVDLG